MRTRTVRALLVALGAIALPGAVAVSCFPDLKELPGSGGATSSSSSTGTTMATGGSVASSTSSTGGTASSTGGSPTDGGGDADAAPCLANTQTDAQNCGYCGHDCCGGMCIGGVCQAKVLAAGSNPGPPTVDDTWIYWPDATGTSDGGILRAPKAGGLVVALTPGQDHPAAVAVDSAFVYWVTNINNPPNYGSVYRASLDGGAPSTLVSGTEEGASFVLVNGTAIYWDDHVSNRIRRSALDGTNPQSVATATDGVAAPLQMAMDSSFVYWADRTSFAIQRAPLFGTGTKTLAMGTDPIGVAVNKTSIFWANYTTGTIQKVPINGGSASTLATSGRGPLSIAADDKYVYWGDEGAPGGVGVDAGGGDTNGSVRAVSVNANGGPGIILAESPNPSWITTDASCVYFTDTKTGNVSVVAKP